MLRKCFVPREITTNCFMPTLRFTCFDRRLPLRAGRINGFCTRGETCDVLPTSHYNRFIRLASEDWIRRKKNLIKSLVGERLNYLWDAKFYKNSSWAYIVTWQLLRYTWSDLPIGSEGLDKRTGRPNYWKPSQAYETKTHKLRLYSLRINVSFYDA
jgi:hypothetical protein